MRGDGDILLVSCYELGHAPHGLAMAAGFLRRAGFAPALLDLAVMPLDPAAVARARVIAVSVPMHTALRLALAALPRLRELAPGAAIGFFGHYAVLHARALAGLGAAFALGGELEEELCAELAAIERRAAGDAAVGDAAGDAAAGDAGGRAALVKLRFPAPDRRGLPPPSRYAHLEEAGGGRRVAGYTEASRGCLDTCRHCPVPAVYRGRFFVVDRETVLGDVAAQVEAGARHITFGDPDFLNGPRHGLAVARELHRRFPGVTFDVTAQVSHLLRERDHLAELVELGCAFVITAVESLADGVLAALAKRHRRADVERLLDLADAIGMVVRPTFVPFTPWTGLDDMVELVDFLVERDLVDRVAPVQLSIRLLVPPGSLLLAAHPDGLFGPLDPAALGHAWVHPDPRVDRLQRRIAVLVDRDASAGRDPRETVAEIRGLVHAAAGDPIAAASTAATIAAGSARMPGRKSPRMSEPWFC
ncbi:MAG TPA: CUAEP/CCAEP-tail radical SAM protein [Kofleriaceae bacterium]|nr:CUAEP/CCAEP-tail radical SAM protein [Kofleriaceae bacterium]